MDLNSDSALLLRLIAAAVVVVVVHLCSLGEEKPNKEAAADSSASRSLAASERISTRN